MKIEPACGKVARAETYAESTYFLLERFYADTRRVILRSGISRRVMPVQQCQRARPKRAA